MASQRILVTVTGPDNPGITAALTEVIARDDASLLDIEQVVVQGQLTLCLLLELRSDRSRGEPVLKDLLFDAKRLGLNLEFQIIDAPGDAPGDAPADVDQPRERWAISAIGDALGARGLHVISSVLARYCTNIESIRQLSADRLRSVEIIVHVPEDPDRAAALRADLVDATGDLDVDIAVQRETLTRRSKRLVVMDMDSTLIRIEVIDELARKHGVVDKVADITRRAMAGELDFEASLRERVGLLAGMRYDDALALASELPVTDGAPELLQVLRRLGYKTAVISGGFTFAADTLKDQLGLDYAYANELEIEDGVLTGRVIDPIVTPERKANLLASIAEREGISLSQTIAVGDGANDLLMLEKAGLGIAFHAKAKLKAAADTSISAGGLDRLLYLLGLHARDIEHALASD